MVNVNFIRLMLVQFITPEESILEYIHVSMTIPFIIFYIYIFFKLTFILHQNIVYIFFFKLTFILHQNIVFKYHFLTIDKDSTHSFI
jgi:hypothetical protein